MVDSFAVCKSLYTDLLQHIRLFHAHKPNLSLQCGIGGCQRVGTHLMCDNDRETPNFDSKI